MIKCQNSIVTGVAGTLHMTNVRTVVHVSACSCDQTEYSVNEELQQLIGSEQVRCQDEGCSFQATLAEYLLHEHGKAAYSNADVDFDCLRPRPVGPPSVSETSSTQAALSTSMRSQLLQVTTTAVISLFKNTSVYKKHVK